MAYVAKQSGMEMGPFSSTPEPAGAPSHQEDQNENSVSERKARIIANNRKLIDSINSARLLQALATANQEMKSRRDVEIEDAIGNGKVISGMSPAQVIQAWGTPKSKSSSIRQGSRFESWTYERYPENFILTFIYNEARNEGELIAIKPFSTE